MDTEEDNIERIEVSLKDGTVMMWANKDQHLMDLILNYIESTIGGPDTTWV